MFPSSGDDLDLKLLFEHLRLMALLLLLKKFMKGAPTLDIEMTFVKST